MKTLIVFSHQYYANSKVNKALLEAAAKLSDVTVRNLDELYGSDFSKINVKEEQQYLEQAERVVFQAPVYWFNIPALLKAYIDNVFTHGWAYGSTGHALEGKEFLLAVSAGSPLVKYEQSGRTVDQLLIPLITTGQFVGMKVLDPFITYGAMGITDAELASQVKDYVALLS